AAHRDARQEARIGGHVVVAELVVGAGIAEEGKDLQAKLRNEQQRVSEEREVRGDERRDVVGRQRLVVRAAPAAAHAEAAPAAEATAAASREAAAEVEVAEAESVAAREKRRRRR